MKNRILILLVIFFSNVVLFAQQISDEEQTIRINLRTFEKIVDKPEKTMKKMEKSTLKEEHYFSNSSSKVIKTPLLASAYDEIIIEVNSSTNHMNVKAKINNEFRNINDYKVSTGKNDIKKPLGAGKITEITMNPIWYPTEDTIKTFKKRGIFLPSAVPSGDKYNYMGAAKINLSHIVDGKNTFRIHGTLNEKTIGTNESAGCIRMKNNDVLQLATFLNQFANVKGLNQIKVILK